MFFSNSKSDTCMVLLNAIIFVILNYTIIIKALILVTNQES